MKTWRILFYFIFLYTPIHIDEQKKHSLRVKKKGLRGKNRVKKFFRTKAGAMAMKQLLRDLVCG